MNLLEKIQTLSALRSCASLRACPLTLSAYPFHLTEKSRQPLTISLRCHKSRVVACIAPSLERAAKPARRSRGEVHACLPKLFVQFTRDEQDWFFQLMSDDTWTVEITSVSGVVQFKGMKIAGCSPGWQRWAASRRRSRLGLPRTQTRAARRVAPPVRGRYTAPTPCL